MIFDIFWVCLFLTDYQFHWISKSKHVSQAFKELEKVNANIIGTILNDVEMYSEKLYYDYSNKSKKSKFINLRNVIKI